MKPRSFCLLILPVCLLSVALMIACGDDDDDDDNDNDDAATDDDAPLSACDAMAQVWGEGCVNAYAGFAGPGALTDIMRRCCLELEETILVECMLGCLDANDDCATQKPCVDDCVAQAESSWQQEQNDLGQQQFIDCVEHGDGEDHSGCDSSCAEAMGSLYECDRQVLDGGRALALDEAVAACEYGSESPANDDTTASCIRIKCHCHDFTDCPTLIRCANQNC